MAESPLQMLDTCLRHIRALRATAFMFWDQEDLNGQIQKDIAELLTLLVLPLADHAEALEEALQTWHQERQQAPNLTDLEAKIVQLFQEAQRRGPRKPGNA